MGFLTRLLFGESDALVPRALRSDRVQTVLQPCASGRAPHRWPSERQQARIAAKSDGDGIAPPACLVCGKEKP